MPVLQLDCKCHCIWQTSNDGMIEHLHTSDDHISPCDLQGSLQPCCHLRLNVTLLQHGQCGSSRSVPVLQGMTPYTGGRFTLCCTLLHSVVLRCCLKAQACDVKVSAMFKVETATSCSGSSEVACTLCGQHNVCYSQAKDCLPRLDLL